jgi:hypothetical protein
MGVLYFINDVIYKTVYLKRDFTRSETIVDESEQSWNPNFGWYLRWGLPKVIQFIAMMYTISVELPFDYSMNPDKKTVQRVRAANSLYCRGQCK